MKRKTASFTGQRPIFTGSPAIVAGGFNLDVEKQRFPVGTVVPAGSLAIYDETKRTVQIVKTATVLEVDSDSSNKKVALKVDEFYSPVFAVGDKVAKAGAITGTYSAAAQITAIDKTENSFVITLSAAIAGLTADDAIVEVVNSSSNAAEIGKANSVTIADVVVSEFETGVDVSADTMQYALFERRVPVIPASQKDATGKFLNANPHVKLTQSY